MERKVNIIHDLDGNEIVIIQDIIFKGRQRIAWSDVETYLKQFVGECYVISETKDLIYIGSDLPDEYCHSEYTEVLKGTNAKAKANAAQGIPEMIKIATDKRHSQNSKKKHNSDAKFGWYRYESRFALPVFTGDGEIERYNVFHVAMIVRHGYDRNLYLYDIMNIKKETGSLFQSEDLTQ